ncbi:hypothetical protein ACI796_11585 [Geodermatophilus sp. SYSU D00525]
MRRWHLPTAVLLVAMVGTVLAADTPVGDQRPPLRTAPSWPGWGFTHTQFSADHGAPAAVRSVESALSAQPLVQAQALMGWGADNPEPSPGRYDFGSLDERIDLIRRSGGIPVITLCCAPDWMKGGRPGTTDWARLTEAPLPEHYADFAALAATVAERYPDVLHFMVWNEFKGFWDEDDDTWDASGYTALYNRVYDAVKAVNPRARIGGPYLSLFNDADGHGTGADPAVPPDGAAPLAGPWGTVDPRVLDAFDYWLAHNRGADFVVVDGVAHSLGRAVDPFSVVGMFSAVNRWIQQRTALPIWWAEWYLDPAVRLWPADRQVAAYTVAMMEFVRSGAETVLYWNPRPRSRGCAGCLWTDTAEDGGGRPLPFLTVLQDFGRWFPPGTALRTVPAPPGVEVLAQHRALVAVNTTGAVHTLTIDGTRLTLSPHETRWITPD